MVRNVAKRSIVDMLNAQPQILCDFHEICLDVFPRGVLCKPVAPHRGWQSERPGEHRTDLS